MPPTSAPPDSKSLSAGARRLVGVPAGEDPGEREATGTIGTRKGGETEAAGTNGARRTAGREATHAIGARRCGGREATHAIGARQAGETVRIGTIGPARLLAGARPVTAPGTASLAADQSLDAHLALHGALPMPPPDSPRSAATPAPSFTAALLAEIDAAGLSGRGGGGFPSARKLAGARAAGVAVLVVNAMEGEPASRKDGILLACAPHLVLDGAELAALAVGATEIKVCVDESRGDVVALLERAVAERAAAERNGWRGAVGDGHVTTRVLRLPGRYVSGEESAVVAGAAGGPVIPSFRPDKSLPLRFGRRAAVVHNAETLAHVALIGRHGARWFRATGDPGAPGTCLVTVCGAVARPAVLEVPTGYPLWAILEAAGADAPVAVLAGGYGGSWLGGEMLHAPWSPAGLSAHGASPGAGVIAVLGRHNCGLVETAAVAAYLAGESAGQCGPCAFGLPAIAADLAAVSGIPGVGGAAGRRAVDALLRRCDLVERRGACRHPDGAARLVRSALSTFADDLAGHLAGRPCRAGAGTSPSGRAS